MSLTTRGTTIPAAQVDRGGVQGVNLKEGMMSESATEATRHARR